MNPWIFAADVCNIAASGPCVSSEFSPKKVCGKRAGSREGDGELRASLCQLAVVFRTDHGVPHCEKFAALICRAVLGAAVIAVTGLL
jgi:hypothetical protein